MKTVIFDFDGTIADSFDYVLGFLSREAGMQTPPRGTDAEQYRGLSMKDMAMKLGIPLWRLPFIYFTGRRVMRAHMEHVQAFAGIPAMLKVLHEDDWNMYVVSSNSVKNIRHLLKRYGVNEYFRAVWGGAGIFGKANILKQLCRRYKIQPATAWYVGDELGDMAAAKVAGVKPIAVTWGFAKQGELEATEPHAIVDTPGQLLTVISKQTKNE